MNKFLLIPLLVVQLLPLKLWLQCKDFMDYYHYSTYDLELQLIYAINHDSGLPVFIARAFHNKVLQGAIDIYKRYTHFLDWQLLITLITLVGVFGVILSIWYFLNQKKKDRRIAGLIILVFLVPFVEVVIHPNLTFPVKLFLMAMPLNLLSFLGHFTFIKKINSKKAVFVYLILITVSVGWMMLPSQVLKYCVAP